MLEPAQSLLALFQNPLHLIAKREDKRLDYDYFQSALEHAEEPEKIKQLREECLQAKRNYEALNAQLLEELPHFTSKAASLSTHLLKLLLQVHYVSV